MDKYKVLCEIEKIQIIFASSPTKGLIFFENLLLPKEDKGMNEAGYDNLRSSFSDSSSDQVKLVEDVILGLKKLRSEVLVSDDARKMIEDQCDRIREEISVNQVIIEQL